ncbi:LPS translocon maturation chaperone LptM [Psychromonas aquimarina]|uniref:LPS translocon maturation chaperone LptM n=1 Tax=Psychromonas aquimarina TaxID=444919 RepID=UPI00041EA231|nr:lipoprotein [Psychromonas aquimarina]
MKNTNILLTTLLFSSLLAGCGMKGPLYRTPVEPPQTETVQQTEQLQLQLQLQQDSQKTSSEEPDSTSENTAISE